MTDGRAPTLQQQVTARLKARMTDFDVQEFPDAIDRFNWKADRTLLVSFGNGTYAAAQGSMAPASTERTREMHVTILLRSLRGPQGAERAIDRLVGHLYGWTPSGGGTCFVPVRDMFQEENEGTWRFVVVFSQTKTIVAYPAEDDADLYPVPFAEADTSVERDAP